MSLILSREVLVVTNSSHIILPFNKLILPWIMLVKHYAYGLKSDSFSIHVENNVRRKLVVFLFLDLTFKRQPHKMVKHTQTVRRKQPKNCLNVFDHFVRLALIYLPVLVK